MREYLEFVVLFVNVLATLSPFGCCVCSLLIQYCSCFCSFLVVLCSGIYCLNTEVCYTMSWEVKVFAYIPILMDFDTGSVLVYTFSQSFLCLSHILFFAH